MMHGHEKSDPEIVAMKPANNAAPAAAEPVECRFQCIAATYYDLIAARLPI